MNETRSCSCPICRVEKELCRLLSESATVNRFLTLTRDSAALAGFAAPNDLVARLHDRNSSVTQVHETDEILGTLLRVSAQDQDLIQAILTVAFIPALHRVSREIRVWFPSLAREDISQQVLTIFLELPKSRAIANRSGYFSLAIARELRRAAYRWAIRESRKTARAEEIDETRRTKSEPIANGHFESSVLLQEFFRRCQESGILSPSDIELLTKLRLEGFEAKEIIGTNGAASAKAIHNRYQRILKRLRDKASSGKMFSLDTLPAKSSPSGNKN